MATIHCDKHCLSLSLSLDRHINQTDDTIEFNGHSALTPMTGENESRLREFTSHRLPPGTASSFSHHHQPSHPHHPHHPHHLHYPAVQQAAADIMMASSIVHMVGTCFFSLSLFLLCSSFSCLSLPPFTLSSLFSFSLLFSPTFPLFLSFFRSCWLAAASGCVANDSQSADIH